VEINRKFTIITHLYDGPASKPLRLTNSLATIKNSVGEAHAFLPRFTNLVTPTVSDESEVCRGRRISSLTPGAVNPRAATGYSPCRRYTTALLLRCIKYRSPGSIIFGHRRRLFSCARFHFFVLYIAIHFTCRL